MIVGIDFGITNTDIAISDNSNSKFFSMPSKKINNDFLLEIFDFIQLNIDEVEKIAVTGGKSSNLNNSFKNIPIVKVNEIDAIGYGTIELWY